MVGFQIFILGKQVKSHDNVIFFTKAILLLDFLLLYFGQKVKVNKAGFWQEQIVDCLFTDGLLCCLLSSVFALYFYFALHFLDVLVEERNNFRLLSIMSLAALFFSLRLRLNELIWMKCALQKYSILAIKQGKLYRNFIKIS